ncbi:hypothetical protein J437_LFUL013391 [Ladona fulva]|uniref:Uncharacterized protein n=1 Tax=Ladona fulva TaxID=123851 RepID=A0A8K0KIK4_LADFU|nr:hypothetical protein J437_LFUL013391 [Ladona fulva]
MNVRIRVPKVWSVKRAEKERVYPDEPTEYTPDKVRRIISSSRVVIFAHSTSKDCKKAFEILSETSSPVLLVHLDEDIDGDYMLDFLAQLTGYRCILQFSWVTYDPLSCARLYGRPTLWARSGSNPNPYLPLPGTGPNQINDYGKHVLSDNVRSCSRISLWKETTAA